MKCGTAEERFKVVYGMTAVTWDVIDREMPLGEERMCECNHEDDALMICEALNGRAP